jgi:putative transposase
MTRPAADYRSGRHCVYLLHAHLVFTPKWRRRVFTKAQLTTLQHLFSSVCTDFEATLSEFNGETDHVHLLVQYPPHVSLSRLINSLKGISSRRLKVLHPEIKKHYWGSALWSRSYFAGSVGGAPIEVLRQYIEQQAAPTT